MAITLASDEYDEIRLQIGGDIDEEDLPDARINGGTVMGRQNRMLLRRIPGGQNGLSTTPEIRAYRRAILYRCAWILTPSFPEQTAETVGPLSARYQGTTVEKRQEILQAQVEEEIQKLVDAGHGVSVDGFVAGFEVFQPGHE